MQTGGADRGGLPAARPPSRGLEPPAPTGDPSADPPPAPGSAPSGPPPPATGDSTPVEFVCEDDVRQAVEADRRIPVNDRTIITPAARDLGERHGTFGQA